MTGSGNVPSYEPHGLRRGNGERLLEVGVSGHKAGKTIRSEETGGFQILRDACQGEPFKDCSNILKICNEIAKDPIIIKTVGSKFQDCPI